MADTTNVRDRILDAAAEILGSHGLKRLNTNALANTAGVTPPTVYRHFDNKEAVVIGLADRFIENERRWLSSSTSAINEDATTEDIVNALVNAYWVAARKEQGMVALRGAMRVWPELKDAEDESLSNSAAFIAQLFRPRCITASTDELNNISRYVVEMVCSTIDRCYLLPPQEQRWRIEELKTSVTSYLTSRLPIT